MCKKRVPFSHGFKLSSQPLAHQWCTYCGSVFQVVEFMHRDRTWPRPVS